MTALSASLIAQLAITPACTVPGMVPQFWPSVIKVESRNDPNALHDDTDRRSYYRERAETIEIAKRLMAQGHSVGVGLSQLTARSEAEFVQKFGLSIEDATLPCLNMRVGASFYVTAALSIYNSGSPTRSLDYAIRVQGVVVPVPTPPPKVRVVFEAFSGPVRTSGDLVLQK